jgi:parallel beta-helix repeat protein
MGVISSLRASAVSKDAILLSFRAPCRILPRGIFSTPYALLGFVAAGVSVLAQAPAPPTNVTVLPAAVVGPTQSITCPSGAVRIAPGSSIQAAVNAAPGATTFCLGAGVHPIASYITPKAGNVFIGEYGAILDGTGWSSTDPWMGAFRVMQDIPNVTIRNLVIRDMPQKAILAYGPSGGWLVEHNEITGNVGGIFAPSYGIIRNNYIHHNIGPDPTSSDYDKRGGGYHSFRTTGAIFEGNEIAYNGPEQKVLCTNGLVFRNNFVHHNHSDGIWYDADNYNALIEGNRVEDNGRSGIFYEINGSGVIRDNTSSRNARHGIMVTTSKNVEIYRNRLENNAATGIHYWLDSRVGQGAQQVDLINVRSYNNTIRVGTQLGSNGSSFAYGGVTDEFAAPYVRGEKNLKFDSNAYAVSTLTGRFWWWPKTGRTWSDWQALGQDVAGALSPGS